MERAQDEGKQFAMENGGSLCMSGTDTILFNTNNWVIEHFIDKKTETIQQLVTQKQNGN